MQAITGSVDQKQAEHDRSVVGPVFDLVGDGGFKAFTFSWFTLKYGNVIEIILVVLIFVVGMFINLPGGKVETPRHRR